MHTSRVLRQATDRRAALKARHRVAIVTAARDLIAEHGVDALSADLLAERADVARRTIFNHFSSLEEVVVAGLEAELQVALSSVDDAVRDTPPSGSALDDLETLLRAPDLAGAVARIARMVDSPAASARAERFKQEAMRHVADPLLQRLRGRHPALSALDAELVTTTAMNGVAVIAATWIEETGGRLDAAGRRRWAELLDHLFTTLRRGFAPPQDAHTPSTPPTSSPTSEGA